MNLQFDRDILQLKNPRSTSNIPDSPHHDVMCVPQLSPASHGLGGLHVGRVLIWGLSK